MILIFSTSPLFPLQNPADGQCFVYPSPASGGWAWAVYNLSSSGTAQVSVYNEAGDLVEQVSAANGPGLQQTPIDLSHFQKGLFICRVVITLDSGASQPLPVFKFIVTR